ncbi:MAG TPA: DNA repair protein [Pseudolabrys sp.]|jgi:protein ImuA
MLEQLRQQLKALQKPAGLEDSLGALPLGIAAIDDVLGGGLARGALHEIAAPAEAHLAAATAFTLGLMPASTRVLWVAEDMACIESGGPYGPGLDAFKLMPERLLTIVVSRPRDLLWAMEEALRCRAIGAVIGEIRHGALDAVAVRRLSLAAGDSGALALLLRAKPGGDASTAATRWIVGAAPSSHPHTYQFGAPRFATHLTRNRRGPTSSWILEWSDTDGRFVLAAPALPVAAPALDRPRRQTSSRYVA